jgi:hypothetical protein
MFKKINLELELSFFDLHIMNANYLGCLKFQYDLYEGNMSCCILNH